MKRRHILTAAIASVLFFQAAIMEAAIKTEEDIFVEVKQTELAERVKKEPKNADAWYSKGAYSYIAGDLPRAIEDFSRFINLNPRNADARRIRGALHLETGNSDAALADFDRALLLSPKQEELYFYRGLAHYAKGDYAKWRRDFHRWTNPTPPVPADMKFAVGLWWNLYKLNLDLNRYIALNPQDDVAHTFQLTVNLSNGGIVWPRRDYQKILDINPDNAAVYKYRALHSDFSPLRARAENSALIQSMKSTWFAIIFDERLHNGAERINYVSKALAQRCKRNPGDAYAHFYRGMYLALYADDESHWLEALQSLGKAVFLAPNFAEAYFERSQARAALGDDAGAAEDYRRAISLKPPLGKVKTNRQIRAEEARGAQSAAAIDQRKAAQLEGKAAELTERVKTSRDKVEALLARGRYWARIGDYHFAAFDFSLAARLAPNDWRAFFESGKIASSTLEQTKAIAHFGRAIALKPDFGEAYRRRGMAYLMKTPSYLTTDVVESGLYRQTEDSLQNAIEDFDRATALDPSDLAARRGKEAAAAAMNNLLRGVAAAGKKARRAPDDPSGYLERGRALREIGDFARALSDLTRAASLSPDREDVYIERAAVYEELGKLADEAYQKLLPYSVAYAEGKSASIREAKKYLREYGNFYGASSRDELYETIAKGDEEFPVIVSGAFHLAKRRYRSAIRDCGAAMALEPDKRPETYLRKADLEYALAKHLSRRGDINPKEQYAPSASRFYYLRALGDYSAYLKKRPGDASAYIRRSDVYKALSKQDLARGDLTKAISLKPDSADAYFKRGAAQADGKADYIKAVSLNPSYRRQVPKPYAQDAFKAEYARINLPHYSKDIKNNPNNYDAYIKRGDAHFDLLQNEAALKDYRRAVSLRPDSPKPYLKRGAVYRLLGQMENAARDYGKALSLHPNDAQAAEAYFRRGEIYAQAGNHKWAARAYARAAELDAAYLGKIGADARAAVAKILNGKTPGAPDKDNAARESADK